VGPAREYGAQSDALGLPRLTPNDFSYLDGFMRDARLRSRYSIVSVAIAAAALGAPISPQTPAPSPVDLPRVYLNTALSNTPSTGRTLNVAPGGNLQAALDSAKPGDRVLVACGVYRGNFVLRAKAGTGWVTVQSAGQIPAEGTRTSPTAVPCFPKLVTPNVSPVLATQAGANRWRLIGLELSNETTAASNFGLVFLGDGTSKQNTDAKIPRNLILDRVYVHGTPNSDSRRCIALNSDSTAIIDSYVSECHSNGFDTQAIWGWNGNGPYKITNNYMEASTEDVGFGGADPSVKGLVPSDIEIRRNHITRPMAWKAIGGYLQKNLVEFKNARRVLIEGNVIENSWAQSQLFAFTMFSVNQNGGCSWCVVEHVTIRNNLLRNVAGGWSLSEMYRGAGSVDATPMNHIAITNNVIIGLDNPAVAGGGYGFQINRSVAGLWIEHNTFFTPSISSFQWNITSPVSTQVIRNNLTGGGNYPLFASPTNTWAAIAGPGSEFAGNVVASPNTYKLNYVPDKNHFPSSIDAIGLVGGSAAAFSVSATLDQLALTPASPYKRKATDGTDVGANIAALKAAIAGVVETSTASAQPTRITKP
jgi:hypothetical protein